MSDLSLQELQKKIADTYALTSNLSLFCNKLEGSLQSLSGQMSEKMTESVKKSETGLQSNIVSLTKEISSFHLLHSRFNELLGNIQENIKKIQEFILNQGSENVRMNHDIEGLSNKLSTSINDLNENMHLNVKKTKEEIYQKIVALPIPLDTVNMQEVQKEIATKIEPASLDARNSLLTARNHELRLGILERKVENALLQLKNLELGDR